MSSVQVLKIYQGEDFIGPCNSLSTVNCALLKNGAKEAWLTFNDGIVPQHIVFSDPDEVDAIKGVWVNEDGEGILVDGEVADFVAKCNACCGENAVVTAVYDGVYPATPVQVAREVTVARADDGSQWNLEKIGLDYIRFAIPNSLFRSSRNNGTGVSTYKFTTYATTVNPQASPAEVTDTVTQPVIA